MALDVGTARADKSGNGGASTLVALDFDGTLADTFEAIQVAVDSALLSFNQPRADPRALRTSIGLSMPRIFQRLLPGADHELTMGLVEAYREAFLASGPSKVALFPGMRALLAALHSRATPLAIVTSKGRRAIDLLLPRLGIANYFSCVVCDEDVVRKKPHPEMVLAAASSVGVPPTRTVVVGDSAFDVEMGRRVGASTCAVTWGAQSFAELRCCDPTHIVNSVRELGEVLRGYTGIESTRDASAP